MYVDKYISKTPAIVWSSYNETELGNCTDVLWHFVVIQWSFFFLNLMELCWISSFSASCNWSRVHTNYADNVIKTSYIKLYRCLWTQNQGRNSPIWLNSWQRILLSSYFCHYQESFTFWLNRIFLISPKCVIFVFPHHNSLQFMNWYIMRR
jgi:hypothetical protein